MEIVDILPPESIAINVSAASKKAVLEELARLVSRNVPSLTPAQAFDGLILRERLGSTGLGNGIAIPHGRIRHLPAMAGAFLRTDTAIDFDAIDGEPVDLFFALFVPEDTTEEHLVMLSHLAEAFSDEGLVCKLREVESAQKVHSILASS